MNYSVLMSVYAKDNPEYLELAIDSMLNQTVKPEQFVIVQDGLLPESIGQVICKYESNQPELFTIIKLETNGGLANALNIGLQACRNELVARMDADDISLPKRCEKELKKFSENPDLVICGCNIDEFYDIPQNVKTSRVVPAEYEDILRFMRRRQPFNHPTVIYKKSKVIEAGGYPQLRRKEDFDLFSRMLSKGYYALNVDESLYLYRANEENYARRKSWVNFKNALYVYYKHLMRHGCTIIDFFFVCIAELIMFFIPLKIMVLISDKILRTQNYGCNL